MNKKFFITAAIPYVNAAPHVGHALEFVQTDTIARYHKLLREDVATLSGGDENALKNVQAAEKVGIPIQEFVDKNTETFRQLAIKLNAEFTYWQRGSDKIHHFPSSQKLWELCDKKGDIYKKKYEGLYCVGCEAFYTKGELSENGECFEHPGKKLERIEEENYFFRLSKYQDFLTDILEKGEFKIYPEHRKNEVLSFLKNGLKDISISRSNERAKNWGVPVPGDPTQREYVWLDALQIYQTGIGFDWNEKLYKKWWPADLHVIGKGILRFHAVYWPAFLHSAGLKIPKALFIHDYFTVNGEKMSKTLGNVIDPIKLIEKYGVDALRYYFLAKFSPFVDGDFSEEKFTQIYNADLANGLGNLVSRVAKLAETYKVNNKKSDIKNIDKSVAEHLEQFRFDLALEEIWKKISQLDNIINKNELWKDTSKKIPVLVKVIDDIKQIAFDLKPFLPQTAEKIENQFMGEKIKSGKPLFPRL